MKVLLADKSHHVEQDDSDAAGKVGWRYEYDLYVLVAADLAVTARSYADTPHEVSLLRFRFDGEPIGLGDVKMSHNDALVAVTAHLHQMGFTSVQQ